MTLSRLKWLAIVAPLAFLVVLYVLLHTVFYSLHHFPGILALFAWAVAGVALFSFSVFALISRLEKRVLEQDRRRDSGQDRAWRIVFPSCKTWLARRGGNPRFRLVKPDPLR